MITALPLLLFAERQKGVSFEEKSNRILFFDCHQIASFGFNRAIAAAGDVMFASIARSVEYFYSSRSRVS